MRSLLITLRHYWKSSLAVLLSAAVTTAVLAGALVVGDSMRGSLRDLALGRLGGIDEALVSESFFREELSADLLQQEGYSASFMAPVSGILLQGSVRAPGSERRATGVGIQGVEDDFSALFGTELLLDGAPGQRFPSVVINQALATELSADVGSDVVLSLARPSDIPRESLMGSTDVSDVVQSLRLTVRSVVDDRGIGGFSLAPSQGVVFNAFVNLADLQQAIGQDAREGQSGRVNAVLVSHREGNSVAREESPTSESLLSQLVNAALQLEDFGLKFGPGSVPGSSIVEDVLTIESREIVLRPYLEHAIEGWAAQAGVQSLSVTSYLANRTRVVRSASGEVRQASHVLPYSTITGMDLGATGFGALHWLEGVDRSLEADEVVINTWAARELGATVGDTLQVEYWEVGSLEELIPRSVELKLVGVLALEGLAADRTLTPPFPGVHDAANMADWEPTFPVDLQLIEDRDEEYWDLYGATPKLFVAPSLAARLWSTRFGSTSSIRLRSSEGARALLTQLRSDLSGSLDPTSAGMAVVPVKEAALRGAKGATDFGGLFLGFSMFLIAAAALLTALFFRLGVERRASEIGLRLGLGFSPRRVQRTFLLEGLVLAGCGAMLGLGLAVAYAWTMVDSLGSRWASALGLESGTVSFLELRVIPLTLVLGGLASFLIVAWTIWRSVKRLERISPVALLRGEVREARPGTPSRARSKASRVVMITGPLMVVVLLGSFFLNASKAAPLFFAAGALLLTFGLGVFAMSLAKEPSLIDRPGLMGQIRMARANTTLFSGRSLLAVALVAAAAFVIVSVGAYGQRFGEKVLEKDSGAGGFVVRAHSDVSIYHDLGSDDGRFELGFGGADEQAFADRTVFSLREVPGDDVSCLNLYQPERPRLLGMPRGFLERGGFTFQKVAAEGKDLENPWSLLQRDYGENVIPAIGDFNSVMWILKSGVGKDVEMVNERGQPIKVRIVGLLHKSIFQRELLIAEDRLLEHFPSRDGYRSFLFGGVQAAESVGSSDLSAGGLVEILEKGLGRFGVDAVGTAQQLEAFQAVENTYLGTFRALGGLGLLLGTLGLGVVLLRGVLERTAELSLLRAVGFSRKFLGSVVVVENALLLSVGLALGAGAALVAVLPHVTGGAAVVPWVALGGTLMVVLLVGLAASVFAARAAMGVVVLDGLRGDR